jgi:hypothetical protein
MVTLAVAPLRQPAVTAALERTILKEVLLAANAAPAARTATIKAALTTSDTLRIFLFTFYAFP